MSTSTASPGTTPTTTTPPIDSVPSTARTATPAYTSETPPPQQPQQPNPSTTTTTKAETFPFPPHHSFPPFYTLQPNLTILSRQLLLWSNLITAYAAHTHLFRLSLSTAPSLPLFSNRGIHRSLDALAIRKVLDWMSSSEGDRRAEWVFGGSEAGGGGGRRRVGKESRDEEKVTAWIWWRRAEEWADLVYAWVVDETGQKGSVLTIYELRESEAVAGKEWVGMDEEMLRRCLDVLVRKGKAQVFESQGGDGGGVKFF